MSRTAELQAPPGLFQVDGVDRILSAVVWGAQNIMKAQEASGFLQQWLERLGEATASSHVRIFANDEPVPGDSVRGSLCAEWLAPGAPGSPREMLQHISYADAGCGRWVGVLSRGESVVGLPAALPESERPVLESQGCMTVALVPIFVEARWWGFMAFSDCLVARSWSQADLNALSAAAGIYGAALGRQTMDLTENRYRRLVEMTLEGLLIHDGRRILDGNPSLAGMVGLTVDEIIGRNPFDFIHPDSAELVRENVRAGYAHPYEARLVRADGTDFPIEMHGRDFVQDGVKLRVTSIRDLTERKTAQLAAQSLQAERIAREMSERSRAHAEFLADATRILWSSFDTTTTLNQLAHLCVRFLGTCCAVSLYGPDDDGYVALVHGPGHHETHSRRTIAEWKATADEDKTLRLRQRRGEAFIIGSAEAAELHEHAVVLEALGARVLLSVPIAGGSDGAVMGSILFIGGPDRAAFDAEERSGAEELGRRAAVALQAAQSYHDALAATAARDEILAVVAHDLRNPLNTIYMGSNLALDLMAGDPTAPERRQLEIIVRTAEQMNRLIQDLLDATRLQSGQLALELVPAQPRAVIDDAVEMLLPLAAHAGITLEAGVVTAVETIQLDRLRIQQVLSNLIGNALKFTPSGGSVRLSAEQAAGEVRFSVTDTGQGIAADQLPHIFGRFWQARRTDRRGLGLGLAIARGIVEAHGGTIRVDSLPGAGSTFAFTIPALAQPMA